MIHERERKRGRERESGVFDNVLYQNDHIENVVKCRWYKVSNFCSNVMIS